MARQPTPVALRPGTHHAADLHWEAGEDVAADFYGRLTLIAGAVAGLALVASVPGPQQGDAGAGFHQVAAHFHDTFGVTLSLGADGRLETSAAPDSSPKRFATALAQGAIGLAERTRAHMAAKGIPHGMQFNPDVDIPTWVDFDRFRQAIEAVVTGYKGNPYDVSPMRHRFVEAYSMPPGNGRDASSEPSRHTGGGLGFGVQRQPFFHPEGISHARTNRLGAAEEIVGRDLADGFGAAGPGPRQEQLTTAIAAINATINAPVAFADGWSRHPVTAPAQDHVGIVDKATAYIGHDFLIGLVSHHVPGQGPDLTGIGPKDLPAPGRASEAAATAAYLNGVAARASRTKPPVRMLSNPARRIADSAAAFVNTAAAQSAVVLVYDQAPEVPAALATYARVQSGQKVSPQEHALMARTGVQLLNEASGGSAASGLTGVVFAGVTASRLGPEPLAPRATGRPRGGQYPLLDRLARLNPFRGKSAAQAL